jgi:hypothetical protein
MAAVRKVAAFDLRRVVGLLNSAAYAMAAQKYTNLTRSKFSDSSAWNAILRAITGETGYPELTQDVRTIEIEQRKNFTTLLSNACSEISCGPARFIGFLEKVQSDRQWHLEAMRMLFRSSISIGNKIAGDLTPVVRGLAVIEYGSTIFVAATPVGLTFAGASALSLASATWIACGYSLTKNLAKDINEARHSGVIAFDTSINKDPRSIGMAVTDTAGQKVERMMENRIEHQTDLIEEAEKEIAKLSRSVARTVSSKKLAKVGRKIDRAQGVATDAAQAVKVAKYATYGARALTVAFAAFDIYEGWEEYEKTWRGAE